MEINIGHSKGTVSSNKNYYGDHSQISFKLFVQTHILNLLKHRLEKGLHGWIQICKKKNDHFQESNSIVTANQNHHIPTTSN